MRFRGTTLIYCLKPSNTLGDSLTGVIRWRLQDPLHRQSSGAKRQSPKVRPLTAKLTQGGHLCIPDKATANSIIAFTLVYHGFPKKARGYGDFLKNYFYRIFLLLIQQWDDWMIFLQLRHIPAAYGMKYPLVVRFCLR